MEAFWPYIASGIGVLLSSVLVLGSMWRTERQHRRSAEAKAHATKEAAKVARDAAEQQEKVNQKLKNDLKAVDDAHAVLRSELREAGNRVTESGASGPTALAAVWNEFFEPRIAGETSKHKKGK